MSKELGIIALGVWVVIIPYLGVPGDWRTILLVLTGIGIALLGFFLRADALSRGVGDSRNYFVDSAKPAEPHTSEASHETLSSLN